MTTPRTFISYSHDSEDHKGWVADLARRLRIDFGIDALLDDWDVELGGDLPRFMENIATTDRVLLICSDGYVKKCEEAKAGGVAYEKKLVTPRLVANVYGDEIIPLLRSNSTGQMPTFLQGMKYIDFREDALFERRLFELAASIHRIEGRKPPIGLNPFRQGLDAGFGEKGRKVLTHRAYEPMRVSCSANEIFVVGRKNGDVLIECMHPNGDVISSSKFDFHPELELDNQIVDAVFLKHSVVLTLRQDTPNRIPAIKIRLDGTRENFHPDFLFQALLVDRPSPILSRIGSAINLLALNVDGHPNVRFSPSGRIALNLPARFPLAWFRTKIVGNSIFVFGMTRENGNDEALLFRFMPDGNLDVSFGEDGLVRLSRLVWFLNLNDIVEMEDGRLLACGNGNEANVIRLSKDGQPDPTFGNAGLVEFRAQGRSTCERVFISGASIFLCGEASDGNSIHNVYVAKLTMDGSTDPNFHTDGYSPVQIKNKDRFADATLSGDSITLLCKSDFDAPLHFRMGLARVHIS